MTDLRKEPDAVPDVPDASGATARRVGPRLDAAWVARYGVYVALALLVAVNLVITDNFATTDNLRLQLVQVVPVLVVALGMALVIGTGGIDLSVGAVMAIAAAVLPLYLGYGLAVAILAAVLAGAVSGALAGSVVAHIGVQPIVVTLAILVGGRGVAAIVGGDIKTLREPSLVDIATGSLLGVPLLVLVAAAIAVVLFLVVRSTTYGRHLVAIGGNPTAARLAGLPVKRVLVTTYVLAGVLAATAGVLAVVRTQSSDPTKVGLLVELYAITAVVVGGTPLTGGQVRILGTVAGALLMRLLENTLVANDIDESVSQMVSAAIVLLAVWVQVGRRPGGGAAP